MGTSVLPEGYFERFETPKYRNPNPIQRFLIRRFVGEVHRSFARVQPLESVLEIGVGEGFLSGFLSERYPEKNFVGVDLNGADLTRLNRKFSRIKTHEGSIYELPVEGPFDLVMCAEVLEHLDEPERGLDAILRVQPKHVLLTVPHEPWFMLSNLLRGKNISRFGNDPEHVNHYGRRSFRRLLEKRFEILELKASYPWLLVLARPRARRG